LSLHAVVLALSAVDAVYATLGGNPAVVGNLLTTTPQILGTMIVDRMFKMLDELQVPEDQITKSQTKAGETTPASGPAPPQAFDEEDSVDDGFALVADPADNVDDFEFEGHPADFEQYEGLPDDDDDDDDPPQHEEVAVVVPDECETKVVEAADPEVQDQADEEPDPEEVEDEETEDEEAVVADAALPDEEPNPQMHDKADEEPNPQMLDQEQEQEVKEQEKDDQAGEEKQRTPNPKVVEKQRTPRPDLPLPDKIITLSLFHEGTARSTSKACVPFGDVVRSCDEVSTVAASPMHVSADSHVCAVSAKVVGDLAEIKFQLRGEDEVTNFSDAKEDFVVDFFDEDDLMLGRLQVSVSHVVPKEGENMLTAVRFVERERSLHTVVRWLVPGLTMDDVPPDAKLVCVQKSDNVFFLDNALKNRKLSFNMDPDGRGVMVTAWLQVLPTSWGMYRGVLSMHGADGHLADTQWLRFILHSSSLSLSLSLSLS